MTTADHRGFGPRRAGRRRFAAALVAALAVLGLSLGIATAATYVSSWGSNGSGHGQFSQPQGVAVDAHGQVYVADTYNSRIEKFTSDGGFLGAWGSRGSGHGQFSQPQGVVVDAHGHVYVADTKNNRIEKFSQP